MAAIKSEKVLMKFFFDFWSRKYENALAIKHLWTLESGHARIGASPTQGSVPDFYLKNHVCIFLHKSNASTTNPTHPSTETTINLHANSETNQN